MAPSAQGSCTPLSFSMMPSDSDLCPLARRVPAPQKTGNACEDSESMQQYHAFKVIVPSLTKMPEMIVPMRGHLMQLLKKSDDDRSRGDMFVDGSSLAKLDGDWLLMFVMEHCTLSVEKLAKMKIADHDALRRLIVFGLQISWTAKLPEEMKHKAVARLVLNQRLAECGDRWAKLPPDFINNDGIVNWVYGCYKLKFDAARATHLTHFDGASVIIPSWKMITTAFNFTDNHDDTLASVSLQGTTHKLKHFFDESDVGPTSYRVWSPKCAWLKQMCLDANKAVEDKAQADALSVGSSSDVQLGSMVQASSNAKRKVAAHKAREALGKRHEDLKKQRRVTLQASESEAK